MNVLIVSCCLDILLKTIITRQTILLSFQAISSKGENGVLKNMNQTAATMKLPDEAPVELFNKVLHCTFSKLFAATTYSFK